MDLHNIDDTKILNPIIFENDLNESQIAELLEYCFNHEYCQVGIAVNSIIEQKELMYKIANMLRSKYPKASYRYMGNIHIQRIIVLDNNSVITMFSASTNARGYRIHLLYVEKSATEDARRYVLKSSLRPYAIFKGVKENDL